MKTKAVILHIDTSKVKEASVSLVIDGHTYAKHAVSDTTRAQALLPLIATVLAQQALQITDITEITIATGPGSFTGLRVGLSVANALGALLDIPVNGKKTLATPVYS